MAAPVPAYPPAHDLLAGKTVVVTAAAGTGIGYATALRCTEEGATVLISDLHERRLGETADRIAEATGKRPFTFLCDVTNEEQVQGLVAAAIAEMGHIDVWMNNAGLGGNAPVVEMTDEQWNKVIDITLTGTYLCSREFGRAVKARRTRSLVAPRPVVLEQHPRMRERSGGGARANAHAAPLARRRRHALLMTWRRWPTSLTESMSLAASP